MFYRCQPLFVNIFLFAICNHFTDLSYAAVLVTRPGGSLEDCESLCREEAEIDCKYYKYSSVKSTCTLTSEPDPTINDLKKLEDEPEKKTADSWVSQLQARVLALEQKDTNIKNLHKDITDLRTEIEALKNSRALTHHLLRTTKEQTDQNLAAIDDKVELSQGEIKRLEDTVLTMGDMEKTFGNKIRQMNEDTKALSLTVTMLSQTSKDTRGSVREVGSSISEMRTSITDLKKSITDLQVRFAGLSTDVMEKVATVDTMVGPELKELKSSQTTLAQALGLLTKKIMDISPRIPELQKRMTSKEAKFSVIDMQMQGLSRQISFITERMSFTEGQIKDIVDPGSKDNIERRHIMTEVRTKVESVENIQTKMQNDLLAEIADRSRIYKQLTELKIGRKTIIDQVMSIDGGLQELKKAFLKYKNEPKSKVVSNILSRQVVALRSLKRLQERQNLFRTDFLTYKVKLDITQEEMRSRYQQQKTIDRRYKALLRRLVIVYDRIQQSMARDTTKKILNTLVNRNNQAARLITRIQRIQRYVRYKLVQYKRVALISKEELKKQIIRQRADKIQMLLLEKRVSKIFKMMIYNLLKQKAKSLKDPSTTKLLAQLAKTQVKIIDALTKYRSQIHDTHAEILSQKRKHMLDRLKSIIQRKQMKKLFKFLMFQILRQKAMLSRKAMQHYARTALTKELDNQVKLRFLKKKYIADLAVLTRGIIAIRNRLKQISKSSLLDYIHNVVTEELEKQAKLNAIKTKHLIDLADINRGIRIFKNRQQKVSQNNVVDAIHNTLTEELENQAVVNAIKNKQLADIADLNHRMRVLKNRQKQASLKSELGDIHNYVTEELENQATQNEQRAPLKDQLEEFHNPVSEDVENQAKLNDLRNKQLTDLNRGIRFLKSSHKEPSLKDQLDEFHNSVTEELENQAELNEQRNRHLVDVAELNRMMRIIKNRQSEVSQNTVLDDLHNTLTEELENQAKLNAMKNKHLAEVADLNRRMRFLKNSQKQNRHLVDVDELNRGMRIRKNQQKRVSKNTVLDDIHNTLTQELENQAKLIAIKNKHLAEVAELNRRMRVLKNRQEQTSQKAELEDLENQAKLKELRNKQWAAIADLDRRIRILKNSQKQASLKDRLEEFHNSVAEEMENQTRMNDLRNRHLVDVAELNRGMRVRNNQQTEASQNTVLDDIHNKLTEELENQAKLNAMKNKQLADVADLNRGMRFLKSSQKQNLQPSLKDRLDEFHNSVTEELENQAKLNDLRNRHLVDVAELNRGMRIRKNQQKEVSQNTVLDDIHNKLTQELENQAELNAIKNKQLADIADLNRGMRFLKSNQKQNKHLVDVDKLNRGMRIRKNQQEELQVSQNTVMDDIHNTLTEKLENQAKLNAMKALLKDQLDDSQDAVTQETENQARLHDLRNRRLLNAAELNRKMGNLTNEQKENIHLVNESDINQEMRNLKHRQTEVSQNTMMNDIHNTLPKELGNQTVLNSKKISQNTMLDDIHNTLTEQLENQAELNAMKNKQLADIADLNRGIRVLTNRQNQASLNNHLDDVHNAVAEELENQAKLNELRNRHLVNVAELSRGMRNLKNQQTEASLKDRLDDINNAVIEELENQAKLNKLRNKQMAEVADLNRGIRVLKNSQKPASLKDRLDDVRNSVTEELENQAKLSELRNKQLIDVAELNRGIRILKNRQKEASLNNQLDDFPNAVTEELDNQTKLNALRNRRLVDARELNRGMRILKKRQKEGSQNTILDDIHNAVTEELENQAKVNAIKNKQLADIADLNRGIRVLKNRQKQVSLKDQLDDAHIYVSEELENQAKLNELRNRHLLNVPDINSGLRLFKNRQKENTILDDVHDTVTEEPTNQAKLNAIKDSLKEQLNDIDAAVMEELENQAQLNKLRNRNLPNVPEVNSGMRMLKNRQKEVFQRAILDDIHNAVTEELENQARLNAIKSRYLLNVPELNHQMRMLRNRQKEVSQSALLDDIHNAVTEELENQAKLNAIKNRHLVDVAELNRRMRTLKKQQKEVYQNTMLDDIHNVVTEELENQAKLNAVKNKELADVADFNRGIRALKNSQKQTSLKDQLYDAHSIESEELQDQFKLNKLRVFQNAMLEDIHNAVIEELENQAKYNTMKNRHLTDITDLNDRMRVLKTSQKQASLKDQLNVKHNAITEDLENQAELNELRNNQMADIADLNRGMRVLKNRQKQASLKDRLDDVHNTVTEELDNQAKLKELRVSQNAMLDDIHNAVIEELENQARLNTIKNRHLVDDTDYNRSMRILKNREKENKHSADDFDFSHRIRFLKNRQKQASLKDHLDDNFHNAITEEFKNQALLNKQRVSKNAILDDIHNAVTEELEKQAKMNALKNKQLASVADLHHGLRDLKNTQNQASLRTGLDDIHTAVIEELENQAKMNELKNRPLVAIAELNRKMRMLKNQQKEDSQDTMLDDIHSAIKEEIENQAKLDAIKKRHLFAIAELNRGMKMFKNQQKEASQKAMMDDIQNAAAEELEHEIKLNTEMKEKTNRKDKGQKKGVVGEKDAQKKLLEESVGNSQEIRSSKYNLFIRNMCYMPPTFVTGA